MRRDLVIAGVSFAGGLALLGADIYTRRGYPEYVLVVPLLVTCAAMALRRRAPMVCLALGVVGICGDAVVGPSLGTVLVFTDNLYAATLYGPRRATPWLVGVSSVVAVGAGALAGVIAGSWSALAVVLVQGGLVLATPVSTAIIIRQHREQAEAERARAEQMAHLAELDQRAAVNAERTRMARELHDMIANHFSAIAIQSTAVLSRKDLDQAAVRRVVECVRENSLQGMAEMRTMIELLRQEGPESDTGEVEATRRRLSDAADLVERSRQSGVVTRFQVDGTARELPASVDLAGYRILQEALTNVLKHGAPYANVVIGYRPDSITLTVENPVGQVPDRGRARGLPGGGAGLIGMRERTALVGGVFEAGPWVAAPAPETKLGPGAEPGSEAELVPGAVPGPDATRRRLVDAAAVGSAQSPREPAAPGSAAGIAGVPGVAGTAGVPGVGGTAGWRVHAELPTGAGPWEREREAGR